MGTEIGGQDGMEGLKEEVTRNGAEDTKGMKDMKAEEVDGGRGEGGYFLVLS